MPSENLLLYMSYGTNKTGSTKSKEVKPPYKPL
jgi:hypothetical protein